MVVRASRRALPSVKRRSKSRRKSKRVKKPSNGMVKMVKRIIHKEEEPKFFDTLLVSTALASNITIVDRAFMLVLQGTQKNNRIGNKILITGLSLWITTTTAAVPDSSKQPMITWAIERQKDGNLSVNSTPAPRWNNQFYAENYREGTHQKPAIKRSHLMLGRGDGNVGYQTYFFHKYLPMNRLVQYDAPGLSTPRKGGMAFVATNDLTWDQVVGAPTFNVRVDFRLYFRDQ